MSAELSHLRPAGSREDLRSCFDGCSWDALLFSGARKFPVKKEFDREFGGLIHSSELVSDSYERVINVFNEHIAVSNICGVVIIIFTRYLSRMALFFPFFFFDAQNSFKWSYFGGKLWICTIEYRIEWHELLSTLV